MEKQKPKNTLNKILYFFTGTPEEWKNLKNVKSELIEEMKTPRRWLLMIYFLLGFLIMFGFMSIVNYIEKNAQYCIVYTVESYGFTKSLIKNETRITGMPDVCYNTLPLPESNKTLQYYYDYYSKGSMCGNQGLKCSFDFNRFFNDIKQRKRR